MTSVNPFACPCRAPGGECRPDERFRCVWCDRVIVGATHWARDWLIDTLFARSMRLAADWWLERALEAESGPPPWLQSVVAGVCSDPLDPSLMAPFHERAGECLRLALFCEKHAVAAERRGDGLR